MRGHVLTVGNIYPDLPQYHHFQRCSNGWVHPRPIRMTFGAHACHPLCRPVVKPRDGLLQPGGHYPRLGPKQEHRLHHRNIEPPHCSLIRSLLSQYIRHLYQFSPLPLEVPFHCRPIVVSGRQRLSQVLELKDHCQRCTILREDSPHLLLRLLDQKLPSLPLCTAPAHC